MFRRDILRDLHLRGAPSHRDIVSTPICICSIITGSLIIQLIDPVDQELLLTVVGVDPKKIVSSRSVACLVA